MALTIYRTDPNGAKDVVGVCDDWQEVGPIIYADRDGIDWEATYLVEAEKENDDHRTDGL